MHRRCLLKTLAAAHSAGLASLSAQRPAAPPPEPFSPSEKANNPIGAGIGIHPGRVVLLRDAGATTWDGSTGQWWDDANTNQKAVHQMLTALLLSLTASKNEKQAWDALFRNFNESRRQGRSGYRPGQRIAIKVNCNQDRSAQWGAASGPSTRRVPNGLPSPHAIAALVTSLIESAGVRGEDILLYDSTGSRTIGSPIYSKIRSNPSPSYQAVQFLAGANYNLGGRLSPEPDLQNPIRFANKDLPPAFLARQVTEAHYMINMALLRPHGMAGVTLTAKNHFGSVYFADGGWSPRTLHSSVLRAQPMGAYNALADLIAHRHLGGKTMLYLLDGLYTAEQNEGSVFQWASLDNQWAASMLN
ncbi:MAG: DUF362 domain-containing protein, partial [Acidobacteria bacterium]|nr:DUF362 domain-containing protein [Acidobacteriota bacterium]